MITEAGRPILRPVPDFLIASVQSFTTLQPRYKTNDQDTIPCTMRSAMDIKVLKDILASNESRARRSATLLKEKKIYMIDLMSSPGLRENRTPGPYHRLAQ